MSTGHAENVALFDMDGTLCDYSGQLRSDLKELMAPGEQEFLGYMKHAPDYVKRRADLIQSSQEWWTNLPRLQLGWDVLEIARELGYRIMILTQGSKRYPEAWTGKKLWIDKNLSANVDLTITRDKGLVYGKVLVDDYPDYMDKWLPWRKNGLGIMPANELNVGYSHKQVIRYDGKNLDDVRLALETRLRTPVDLDQLLRKGPEARKRVT